LSVGVTGCLAESRRAGRAARGTNIVFGAAGEWFERCVPEAGPSLRPVQIRTE